jgi:hypothetical protein
VSEEWPRVRNGPNISRGQTQSLQVTLCLVLEGWPRVRNGPGLEIRNNPSSLVEKNGADSPLLIFYTKGRHCRNGPGWGIVQDSHSLGQTHSL